MHIAVLGSPLPTDHEDYKKNLLLYENVGPSSGTVRENGTAITGLVAGKEEGIAPDANIYYLSIGDSIKHSQDGHTKRDVSGAVKGIQRLIEINKALSKKDQIHVAILPIAFTQSDSSALYTEIDLAKKSGIFVVTPSLEQNFQYHLVGLQRDATKSPDAIQSYSMNQNEQNATKGSIVSLAVPCGERTYASPISNHAYTYNTLGDPTFTSAWLGGMYALCLQIDPNLTIAMEERDRMQGLNAVIMNPQKMMDKVSQLH